MTQSFKVGDPVYFDHWRGKIVRIMDLDGDDTDGSEVPAEVLTVKWDDGSGFTCFRADNLEPRRPN